MSRRCLHTFTRADLGKRHLVVRCPCCETVKTYCLDDVMGRVQAIDVGKQLWVIGGVLQVENDVQVADRWHREHLDAINRG
jgi:hypothetical protein